MTPEQLYNKAYCQGIDHAIRLLETMRMADPVKYGTLTLAILKLKELKEMGREIIFETNNP